LIGGRYDVPVIEEYTDTGSGGTKYRQKPAQTVKDCSGQQDMSLAAATASRSEQEAQNRLPTEMYTITVNM
jgi:hypothetical protein